MVLFFAIAVFLWMLDASLASEEGFNSIKEGMASPLCQFIVWGCLAALAYHVAAGVRHLIMDFGIGESLEGGRAGAKAALVAAAILILLATIWVL